MRIVWKAIAWGVGLTVGAFLVVQVIFWGGILVLSGAHDQQKQRGGDERVTTLPGPYEIFEIQDRESMLFQVVRFEEGEITINPKGQPAGKVVEAMRIYVTPTSKPAGVPYWDITSKLLRAQLRPFLQDPVQSKRLFKVTAHGVPPTKRFSVEVN